MENPELKACPCGGQPELIEENTDMNLSLKGVRCKKCGEAIPVIHDHAPEAIQAWNDWAGGRQLESSKVEEPSTLASSNGSAAACELDNVRDAIVTFDARGNRWNILKAICNPKSSIIKLVLPKSTIVISAKPQPNIKADSRDRESAPKNL